MKIMLQSLRAALRPSARPSHHQTEDEDARTGSRRCSPALVSDDLWNRLRLGDVTVRLASLALCAVVLAGCSTPQGTFSQRYQCWDQAYSKTAPLPQLLIFGDPHTTAQAYDACMAAQTGPTP